MNTKHKRILVIIAIILAFLLLTTSLVLFIFEINDDKGKNQKVNANSQASSVVDDSENDSSEKSDDSSKVDDSSDTDDSKTDDSSTKDDSSNGANPQSNKLSFSFKVASTWQDAGGSCAQLDVTVINNDDVPISSWSAEFSFPNNAEITQIWNAEFEKSGDKHIIKSQGNSQTISSNGTTSFGFIVKGIANADDIKILSVNTEKSNSNTNNNNQNNNQQNNNSQNSDKEPVQAQNALEVPAPSTDDWLSVKGNKIVDSKGKEVWLTGVNWFGYNTGTNTFDGLWSADLNSSLQGIADKGFNLLRIPISAELILQWKSGNIPQANFNQATNNYLVGMNSLEIFDYVVGQCRASGLKIMIDIHSAETDAQGHIKPVWYSDSISEQDFLNSLSWMAKRYAKDDTILAYDLKNEPHGKPNESPRAIWNNSKDKNNWKYIAEKASMAVLNNNPNALVMVEGIEIYPIDIKANGDFKSQNSADYYFNWWGGNLRGVKDYPLELGKYQNKLVYSPHDYGPTVFEQPWFEGGYTFKSLYDDCWGDNWMFIHEDNIAPLLIGEWGGYMREPNLKWMTYLKQLIKENKLHHTFWCFNANSGDTGGLVLDDFKTWDMEKYNFVKDVLWQENGKFVGLDHKIPLGKNGKTLS